MEVDVLNIKKSNKEPLAEWCRRECFFEEPRRFCTLPPVFPYSLVEETSHEPCESQPMPRMRNAPARSDVRGVMRGNSKRINLLSAKFITSFHQVGNLPPWSFQFGLHEIDLPMAH